MIQPTRQMLLKFRQWALRQDWAAVWPPLRARATSLVKGLTGRATQLPTPKTAASLKALDLLQRALALKSVRDIPDLNQQNERTQKVMADISTFGTGKPAEALPGAPATPGTLVPGAGSIAGPA